MLRNHYNEDIRKKVLSNHISVWLNWSSSTIKKRITNSKNLSQTEMNLIIDRLFACENPKYSPDGKPNYIELGIDKVENLF